MPAYDYRCNACGRKFGLFYKSYKDYDAATAANAHTCPNCGSHDLTRLISRVAIARPGRDYAQMSANEMLSVMEGGDNRELGQMMHQLGQDEVVNNPAFGAVTERLGQGDAPASSASDQGGGAGASSAADDS